MSPSWRSSICNDMSLVHVSNGIIQSANLKVGDLNYLTLGNLQHFHLQCVLSSTSQYQVGFHSQVPLTLKYLSLSSVFPLAMGWSQVDQSAPVSLPLSLMQGRGWLTALPAFSPAGYLPALHSDAFLSECTAGCRVVYLHCDTF